MRTSYRLQLSFFWLYLRGSQPSVCPALLCNPCRNQVAPIFVIVAYSAARVGADRGLLLVGSCCNLVRHALQQGVAVVTVVITDDLVQQAFVVFGKWGWQSHDRCPQCN